MYPKMHPVYKTYIDLKRCAGRIDHFMVNYPEEMENEAELFLDLHKKLIEVIEMIPKEYR